MSDKASLSGSSVFLVQIDKRNKIGLMSYWQLTATAKKSSGIIAVSSQSVGIVWQH
jgi:hypothetical protein